VALFAVIALMFQQPHAIAGGQGSLAIELNKLEPQEHGCRAYIVVTNVRPIFYKSLKLDLVVFQTDGIIGRRFAIEFGPLAPEKRSVKLFEIEDVQCEQIGSLLINDVLACEIESAQATDCLAEIAPSSLAKAQLTK